MKNNIVLIGMPGCGKSTIGVVLAKNLGYHFMDSDLVIQNKTGKLLHEIISQQGLEGFLKVENDINKEIDVNKTVIATGGSVVYGEEAMHHLKEIGTVIYFKLPFDAIEERLGDLTARGVAKREGQSLADLYKERIPLYETYADITIQCEDKQIREIIEEINQLYHNK